MSVDSSTPGVIYDVCVVGAGLTGSAAARWTTTLKKGIKVCLVGPNEPTEHEWSDPCRTIFGAHYDQGRVVSEVCLNNTHDSWVDFTHRSIARLKDLEKESGTNFYREGRVVLISDQSAIDESWRKRRNKTTAQCFRGVEFSNAVPAFKPLPDDMGAILETSEAGYINPRAYIAANKLVASRNGCDIIEEVVQEVRDGHNRDNDDGVDETGQHMTARTKSGRVIRAKRVLLCPGAFINFKRLLPDGLEVDISTTSERVVLFEVQDKDVERLSTFPCGCVDLKDDKSMECYFLPAMEYPDGKYYLKIGQGSDLDLPLESQQDIIDWYRRRGNIPTSIQNELISRFFAWVKDFKPKSVRASTCVITNTPTRRYYCDMATPNLGVVVGGNGSGACVADEIGKMGAQMIVRGSWDNDFPAELFKLRDLNLMYMVIQWHCTVVADLFIKSIGKVVQEVQLQLL